MPDNLELSSAETARRPIVNIVGERVALGPLHRGLLPLIERWDNDFRTVDLGGDDSAATVGRVYRRRVGAAAAR